MIHLDSDHTVDDSSVGIRVVIEPLSAPPPPSSPSALPDWLAATGSDLGSASLALSAGLIIIGLILLAMRRAARRGVAGRAPDSHNDVPAHRT